MELIIIPGEKLCSNLTTGKKEEKNNNNKKKGKRWSLGVFIVPFYCTIYTQKLFSLTRRNRKK